MNHVIHMSYGSSQPMFWCPGCKCAHIVHVTKPNSCNAQWTWNGDVDKPTFSPSIHVVGMCHSFVRDGNIQFLGDSKHALAGKTVPIEPWPFEEEDEK